MLYDRWRQVAGARRRELALRDLGTGRSWTFAELAAEAERGANPPGPLGLPQGITGEFILTVLRAWRGGQVVCPLDAGQIPPSAPVLPVGCVHLKTTSASTGAARHIAFTAEQLAADAANVVATMGLRPDWPNLGVISLAHSYGFSNLVTPLLLHGIPLVLVPAPLPEAVRAAAATVEAVTIAAVPALWRTWHEAEAILPNLRLAISAGAPLPLPLEQAVFTAYGVKLHNFYGSSECGGIAYDRSETLRTEAACAGGALDNVRLDVGPAGTLEVRGPAVGAGYVPEGDAALAGGCFRTNDLVELRDGLVLLRGRAGDQINIAGRKVSPEMIERALLAHPAVRECLVFGAPSGDVSRNDLIVAVVAPRKPVSADELKQFLLRTLPAWQVPREWRFVDALPTNQRGKLSRAEWRRRFGAPAGLLREV